MRILRFNPACGDRRGHCLGGELFPSLQATSSPIVFGLQLKKPWGSLLIEFPGESATANQEGKTSSEADGYCIALGVIRELGSLSRNMIFI
jgi:hypothetical protein